MDMKKTVKVALPAIVLTLFLIILSLGLHIIASFVTTEDYAPVIRTINMSYNFLLFPLLVGVYFWSGRRGTKKHGVDAMTAGFAGAFAFGIAGGLKIALDMVLSLLVMKGYLSLPTFRPIESVLSAVLFGSNSGLSGLGAAAICGTGIIMLGAMVCFVFASFGSLLTPRKFNKF